MRSQAEDWAAIGIVLGPKDEVVLVRDLRHPDPIPKLPGGKVKKRLLKAKKRLRETPEKTFLRELEEETRLSKRNGATKKRLKLVAELDRQTHIKYIYFLKLKNLKGMGKGVTGEVPMTAPSLEALMERGEEDFLKYHKRDLEGNWNTVCALRNAA